jgi:hypothetical protein
LLPDPLWDPLIERAVQLLDEVPDFVWDREALPVPIDDIADSHLGLRIREVDHMSRAPGLPAEPSGVRISGLLLPDRGEIWVNAEEARRWPRRRRYTIAHEMGHWVLHRDERSFVHCRSADVRPVPIPTIPLGGTEGLVARFDDGLSEDVPLWRPRGIELLEEEANIFGGALLMPPALMRKVYGRCNGDLERVADAFECSVSAVSGRWWRHYYYGSAHRG